MAYKLIIATRAKKDVQTAYDYIAERSPKAAKQWYRRIQADIKSLQSLPARCPFAPESTNMEVEVRQLIYGRYRTIFRIDEKHKVVHVLTIRHSARRSLSEKEIQSILETGTK